MPEFKKTVYVLIALIITGCGTAPKGEGPVFSFNPSKDGMGTVYHYRLERVYGGAM